MYLYTICFGFVSFEFGLRIAENLCNKGIRVDSKCQMHRPMTRAKYMHSSQFPSIHFRLLMAEPVMHDPSVIQESDYSFLKHV
jgi:hypothetical protein